MEPWGMTDEERAVLAYAKIAEQIIKEDARIHERMTWGVSVNGALFALLGAGAALFKDALPQASRPLTLFICAIVALLSLMALLVCRATIGGVQDARKQIYYVRKLYTERWKTAIETELGLPRPFGSRELYEAVPISRWWGDNFFRFIGAIWILIVLAAAAAAAYHLFVAPPAAEYIGIGV
jgi:hypothetical protein